LKGLIKGVKGQEKKERIIALGKKSEIILIWADPKDPIWSESKN
jgi:hypothetical protein